MPDKAPLTQRLLALFCTALVTFGVLPAGVLLPFHEAVAAGGLAEPELGMFPTAPVGTISGAFDVDRFGNGTYSIPLDLPANRGSLIPQLTLVNASSGAHGRYGWGWRIQGVPVIDDCHLGNGSWGKCLDGNALLGDHSQCDPDSDAPGVCFAEERTYETFPKSNVRVTRYGRDQVDGDEVTGQDKYRWKVEYADGREARFRGCGSDPCYAARISDRSGNYIEIDARNSGRNGLVLEEIRYTGNQLTEEEPQHAITFKAQSIRMPGRYYWLDTAYYDPCEAGDPQANGCGATSGTPDGIGPRLLSSISLCAGEPPEDGPPTSECVPPTRFQYDRAPDALVAGTEIHDTNIPELPCHGPFFEDFTGDGLTDVLYGTHRCSDEKLHLWVNGGPGVRELGAAGDFNVPTDAELFLRDADSDGSVDLFFHGSDRRLYVVSKMDEDGDALIRYRPTEEGSYSEDQYVVADLNNDGALDVVACEGDERHIVIYPGGYDIYGHVLHSGILPVDQAFGFQQAVSCEAGPMMVTRDFGRDLVKVAKTGEYREGKHPITDLLGVTDLLEQGTERDPPGDKILPFPRLIYFADGEFSEAPWRAYAWGWPEDGYEHDWRWQVDLPTAMGAGVSKTLTYTIMEPGSSNVDLNVRLHQRRYAPPPTNFDGRIHAEDILPRLTAPPLGPWLEGVPRLTDKYPENGVAEVGRSLSSLYFFDWNGDRYPDLLSSYPDGGDDETATWKTKVRYWDARSDELNDVTAATDDIDSGNQLLAANSEDERMTFPVPAQNDYGPGLELWEEIPQTSVLNPGDIRVHDRLHWDVPLTLEHVEDGNGATIEIRHSPAGNLSSFVRNTECEPPERAATAVPPLRTTYCLRNGGSFVSWVYERRGLNGFLSRSYEYVDGRYDSITGRFLGFRRTIERTNRASGAVFDNSEIVRVRAYEDTGNTVPLNHKSYEMNLPWLLDYDLTIAIDDRTGGEGRNDGARFVDYSWGVEEDRIFTRLRREAVFEADGGSSQAFRVDDPTRAIVDGLEPSYETFFAIDEIDEFGNVLHATTTTSGEETSIATTFVPRIQDPYTNEDPADLASDNAVYSSTRARWLPARPAARTVTYPDGEEVVTTFNYYDETGSHPACDPLVANDTACSALATTEELAVSGVLRQTVVDALEPESPQEVIGYDTYGNIVAVEVEAELDGGDEDSVSVQRHVVYDDVEHQFATSHFGPLGEASFVDWSADLQLPVAFEDSTGRRVAVGYDGLGRFRRAESWGAYGTHSAEVVRASYLRVEPEQSDADGLLTPSAARIRRELQSGPWSEVTLGQGGDPILERWRAEDDQVAYREYTYTQWGAGEIASVSEPAFEGEAGGLWEFVNDALGRRIEAATPAGDRFVTGYLRREQRVYDAESHPPTRYLRDDFGRIEAVVDPAGTAFCYSYDVRSNLDRVEKDCSLETGIGVDAVDFDYDVRGQLVRVEDSASGRTDYGYDWRGRPAWSLNAEDELVEFEYDAADRVVSRRSEPGGTTHYHYDDASDLAYPEGFDASPQPGQLVAAFSDLTGTETWYSYDEFARPSASLQIIDGAVLEHGYSYDGYGRPETTTYPSVDAAALRVGVEYDDAGFVSSVSDEHRHVELWSNPDRDASGRVLSYQAGPLTSGRNYDELGRIEAAWSSDGDSNIYARSYQHTPNGNLESRENALTDVEESFTYDELNRLLTSSLSAQSWDYDKLGNMTQGAAYESALNGQIASVEDEVEASYDAAGRLVSLEDDARTLGILRTPDGQPWVITSSTPCCGEMSPADQGVETVELTYGPGGELVRRIAEYADDSLIRRDTIYSGAFEFADESDGVDQSVRTERVTLALGGGASVVVASSSDSEDATYYFVDSDPLGSAEVVTEQTVTPSGELGPATISDEDSRSYDAWGQARSSGYVGNDASFSDVNIGYTGHRAQRDGGLIDMNLRHYDPTARKFLSPDPVVAGVFDTQAWNPYSYVRNNPTSLIDPTGAYGENPNGGGSSGWADLGPTFETSLALGAAFALPVAVGFYELSWGRLRGDRSLPNAPGQASTPRPKVQQRPAPITEVGKSHFTNSVEAVSSAAGPILDTARSGARSAYEDVVSVGWDDAADAGISAGLYFYNRLQGYANVSRNMSLNPVGTTALAVWGGMVALDDAMLDATYNVIMMGDNLAHLEFWAAAKNWGAAAWSAQQVFGAVYASVARGPRALGAAAEARAVEAGATVELGEMSALQSASEAALKAADNIKRFVPKNKHLLGGGSQSKARFDTASLDEVRSLVSEALRSPNAHFRPNPNVPGTFRVVTDLQRRVGVKGQQSLRVIVGQDGQVINAFPVHTK